MCKVLLPYVSNYLSCSESFQTAVTKPANDSDWKPTFLKPILSILYWIVQGCDFGGITNLSRLGLTVSLEIFGLNMVWQVPGGANVIEA